MMLPIMISVAEGARDPLWEGMGCRILLIDDSEEVVSTLGETLSLAGFSVATASGGREALAVAAQHRPQLVLCDLRMPHMSGWEVARQLRERYGSSMMLAALSGWSSPGDRARSKDAGFDRHVTKPASIHELRALATEAATR